MRLQQKLLEDAFVTIHPEWHDVIENALGTMDSQYLEALHQSELWLPGRNLLFAAFRQPLSSTQYLLLGESPYPRPQSANGFAFWDAAVGPLWSETGLSKAVNRATSLRNLIKMMLYARGDLHNDVSQDAIARLDKSAYVQTLEQLFQRFLHHGFLLLNASLVYEAKRIPYHAKHWRPFMAQLLLSIAQKKPDVQLILLGRIAQQISQRTAFSCFEAEHPYQLTFVKNPKVVDFFKPLNLLEPYVINY